jgi:hypothetical protein
MIMHQGVVQHQQQERHDDDVERKALDVSRGYPLLRCHDNHTREECDKMCKRTKFAKNYLYYGTWRTQIRRPCIEISCCRVFISLLYMCVLVTDHWVILVPSEALDAAAINNERSTLVVC